MNETSLGMPADVVMHWPYTWVIRNERENNVTCHEEQSCVTARRVVKVKDYTGIVRASIFGKDPEIMFVAMQGMGKWDRQLHIHEDHLVGCRKFGNQIIVAGGLDPI
jgi:hypothetical protein